MLVAVGGSIPNIAFTLDSPLVEIRQEIASELHLMTIEGQDELLSRYASAIEIYDTTFTTEKVTFDRDTSVLTSYAYATPEFTKKYKPEMIEKIYLLELSHLCDEPHVKALRSAGFTHKLVVLKRENNEIFVGFEINADMLNAEFADLVELQKLYARRKARANGDTLPIEIPKPCIQRLGWRETELKSKLKTAGNTKQKRCEYLKQVEMLQEAGIDIHDYRETPFVVGVKARYQEHVDSDCSQ